MLDSSVIEQGKEFTELAKEILPLVKKMEGVLVKHGVSCMASLTTDVSDGYFTFSTHASKWEMGRSDSTCPVKLKYSFSEELVLEEGNVSPEEVAQGQEPKKGFIDLQKEA